MSKMISHYRLEEELGQGGTGRVYKAYDTILDRTVVLKLLAPELLEEPASRSRFLREARLASALDHPNICTIYEIAEADNQYFIAMQYVPGKTLKRLIGSQPFTLESLLSVGLQVADALAAAHATGIIHRDIKSSNIIITPKGRAKVLDFGLAKLLTEKPRGGDSSSAVDELTNLGNPMGTPSYMSPEQARGERVDHRSDIYSFGVVLYEMATGRVPFKGSTQVDTMHALLHDDLKPVSELNPRIPAELSEVIEKALPKKPADRYQSMQRLLQDLQLCTAVRLGGPGVPDGLTVPFISPRRQTPLRSLVRHVTGFFRRESSGEQHLSLGRGAAPDSSGPREQQTPTPKAYSLAILPFRNLSGDPQADFYAMSLADSLITELARAKSIAVMPSSIVARYQNQSINPVQVLAELKADAILVGNFLKAGDRLRVTTQLVNASGEIVWSEKIDGDATDVLAIQDRITERTIAGLAGGRVSIDPTQLLKDESEEVRLDAVRTLKFSHDPRALSALIEAVRDPSLRVKSEAVQALLMLGHEATGPVIALLNDAMDEGDHLTARFAAKALGLIGDRSITPVLIELLGSDDKFVVCEAILSAGRLGDMTVVPELITRLEDPNGNVRFAAAEALGHLCDPAARESLQQRLNDEDEGVRAKARWALSRLRIADRKSHPDPHLMRGAVSS